MTANHTYLAAALTCPQLLTRNKQPAGGTFAIDRSNPLTRGLEFAFIGGREYRKSLPHTMTGGGFSSNRWGRHWVSASTSDHIDFVGAMQVPTGGLTAVTVIYVGIPLQSGVASAVVNLNVGGTNIFWLNQHSYPSTGKIGLTAVGLGDYVSTFDNPNAHCFIAVTADASAIRYFLNDSHESAAGTAFSSTAGTGTIRLSSDSNAGTTHDTVYVYNRALSIAEVKEIRRNLYGFMKPAVPEILYAVDITAPVLTSAVGTATGSTTATIGATTDEANGTMYGVVTGSATQPSVAQIKAGQDHTGAAASYASSQSISSTGAKTFSATGLTASTTYYGHIVHADAAANDSNRLSSASFTTDAASTSKKRHGSMNRGMNRGMNGR